MILGAPACSDAMTGDPGEEISTISDAAPIQDTVDDTITAPRAPLDTHKASDASTDPAAEPSRQVDTVPDDAVATPDADSGGPEEGTDATVAAPPMTCGLPAGSLPLDEGAYIAQGESHTGTREFCTGLMHAIAGAAGSTISVSLSGWGGEESARVRIEDLLGNPLVDWTSMSEGDSVSVSPPMSGEVLVRLEPLQIEEDTHAYTVAATCEEGCDLEYTRYPVLLMHGMAGTETYINLLDYWFQLEAVLLPPGFNVQIRDVESFQGTLVRSEQWLVHLHDMIDAGVGRKFNLIGHSQGGIDARLVTATKHMQGRIASVVTVAAPHYGSPAAEVITGTFNLFPISADISDGLAWMFGGLLGLSGADLAAQIADLTPDAMEAFNVSYPDVSGVYYASYAGRSCGVLDLLCQWSNMGEIVDPVFTISHAFITMAAGDNDGIVPVESAMWGDYQGTIPADHMDEVGQIADFFNLSFDHKAFFLGEIRRLADLGY
jgi:triacylglycerol esterase/lipase EstA (alpha/beta hydrolase family)